jgi:hypothetical protein
MQIYKYFRALVLGTMLMLYPICFTVTALIGFLQIVIE